MSRFSGLARTATGFLRTPKGKSMGVSALQKAAGAANRLTGDKHATRIEKARSAAENGLRRL